MIAALALAAAVAALPCPETGCVAVSSTSGMAISGNMVVAPGGPPCGEWINKIKGHVTIYCGPLCPQGVACAQYPLHVDAALLNPAVTPHNLDATICRPGWTKTIRPSSAYIAASKRLLLKRGMNPKGMVVDHSISLSLGGSPRMPNLRLQTIAAAKIKDREEQSLHRAVCAGRITLKWAQTKLLRDWP